MSGTSEEKEIKSLLLSLTVLSYVPPVVGKPMHMARSREKAPSLLTVLAWD